MKHLIHSSIIGLSLIVQTTNALYGIKGTAIDFSSNEQYNDGAISNFYKPNNLNVNLACGTITDDVGNGIRFLTGEFLAA